MRTRAVVLGVTAAVLAAGVPAALAAAGSSERAATYASSTCVADAAGDVTPTQVAAADIRELCVDYGRDTISAVVVPAQDVNPATDPTWEAGESRLDLELDVDGDLDTDFVARLDEEGGLRARVLDAAGTERCAATPGYDAGQLRIVLPSACIGNPLLLAATGLLIADTAPTDPESTLYSDRTAVTYTERAPRQPDEPAEEPTPTTGRAVERIAGGDRFATSAAIARYQFPNGAAEVYLARADDPADAVAGGTLTRGPILLVPSCGTVPAVVLDEVRRLDPTTIVALGGPGAVCDAVLDQVAQA